jgi:hypothetical protein
LDWIFYYIILCFPQEGPDGNADNLSNISEEALPNPTVLAAFPNCGFKNMLAVTF